MRVFEWLGGVILLGGCSAMLVAPVSVPLWIVVGYSFSSDPPCARCGAVVRGRRGCCSV